MIPKKMYFYWGNEKMSFMRYMTLKSFQYYNPDFEMILITPTVKTTIIDNAYEKNQQDNTYFTGDDYTHKLKDLKITYESLKDYPDIDALGLKDHENDDIIGWYILAFKGGFKADMDILFTAPIPYGELSIHNAKQFTNLFYYYGNYAIGFLYSEPSKFYEVIYKGAMEITTREKGKGDYQKIGGSLLRFLIQRYSIPTFQLNNKYIYPYVDRDVCPIWTDGLNKPYNLGEFNKVSNITFGIHWYGGWPTSKNYNEILTEDNYKDYDMTLSKYIEKVLEK